MYEEKIQPRIRGQKYNLYGLNLVLLQKNPYLTKLLLTDNLIVRGDTELLSKKSKFRNIHTPLVILEKLHV